MWAPPGTYCTFLSGVRFSDGRAYTDSADVALVIVAPTPITVEVKTQPEIPALVPSAIREVVARARNDRGDLRTVARLDVFADEFIPGRTHRSLVQIGSCTGVAECRVLLPPPRSSGTTAIRAEARDLDQLIPEDTGVRLVDLVLGRRGVDIRVNVATLLEGEFVVELPRRFGVDVAFHGSLDGPTDGFVNQMPFSSAVGRQIDIARGFTTSIGPTTINPNQGPSSIQENIARTSFWAVAEPAIVIGSGGANTTSTDMCQIVRAAWSGSADVNAVLHTHPECRDFAFLRHYTAALVRPNVGWHEFHHRPFDEADEYCCDSMGYGQHPSEPNLYVSQAECVALSSDPNTCSMIRHPRTGATLPWFVSDSPTNDVMTFGTGRENADDLRRVRAHYAQCARGGC
jgi:hypothetical protein